LELRTSREPNGRFVPPPPTPVGVGTRAVATIGDGTAADGRPRGRAQLTPAWLGDWRRLVDTAVMIATLGGLMLLVHEAKVPGALGEFLAMRITVKNFLLVAVFSVYWQACLVACGAYESPREEHLTAAALGRVALGCTIGSVGAFIFPLISKTRSLTPELMPVFWGLVTVATLGARWGGWAAARTRRARSGVRRVVFVGSGPRAAAMWGAMCRDPLRRYELVSLFDVGTAPRHQAFADRPVEPLAALERSLMHLVVDQVIIALPVRSCYSEIEDAIRMCERSGVQSRIPADVFGPSLGYSRLEGAGGTAVVAMHVVQGGWRVLVKRAIDFVGALAGLVVLSPALVVIAIAVKLSSPGPALFGQERYGLQKRRFRMLKYRTMVVEAEQRQAELEARNEASGPVFKIKDYPRVTPVGRFLRRTSLDELPQLWNVLRGEMSLVGPRPLPLRDVGRFEEPWLMRRFSVRPGITGLWQVSGRSALGFDAWIRLDLAYIDEWSLGLDARILVQTVPAVLKGTGAA
jgi:exopolysaccharide biosynthesis polyprenyl glycosylphosphotransferase